MSDTGRTAAPGGTIRAVVVDDSALMRQLLAETLGAQEGIAVVGTAADPYAARELIRALDPDVVVLDIEMPRMDGLTFLQKIMQLRPMPVVMCSALTAEGSDAAIRALELGAVDCVAKPRSGDRGAFADFCAELAASVRLAAGVRVQPHRAASSPRLTLRRAEGDAIIAIGASTGGVERIRELLERLPATAPPIAVVQHMAPGFLGSFAARLDRQTPFSVTLARDGLRLLPGSVAIAPGGAHLTVRRDGAGGYRCALSDDPPAGGHRPAVDTLFASVAEAAGPRGIGIILSGMGRDGAAGLAAMRAAGGRTLGESESSCVVYGMPRAAREAGAVAAEMPLAAMPDAVLRALEDGR